MTRNSASPWRMLPPAGAPLTMEAVFSGLVSLATEKEAEESLRHMLAERFGVRHIHFADTGRAALSLSLLALSRMRPGRDEVLIPAYVSFSVPSAVVNAGFKVALYDVSPDSLTPDYETMQKAASERTLAIIVCPQFGLPFDPAPAAAVCQSCGAALVDDAAQAMGGMIRGKYAGCLGDVGIFSLSRGKPLTAVDGGILITHDDRIAQNIDAVWPKQASGASDTTHIIKAVALLCLRNPLFYKVPASLPFLNIGASIFDPSFQRGELSRFRAGLAYAAVPLLDRANAYRIRIAGRYYQMLASFSSVHPVLPQPESVPIYLRFPVLPSAEGRNQLQALMRTQHRQAKKLGISRGFPLPLNAVPALRLHLAKPEDSFPGARFLAENLITLPTHDQVREHDLVSIARFLAAADGKETNDTGETRP